MTLHFAKVALTLNATIPGKALEQHIAATPAVVASELAHQVYEYERANHLGYYPAIDYFDGQEGIDPDLIHAIQNIAWVATSMVRNEIQTRMRPVFSNIQFESIQTQAYTLPSIRPHNPNAIHELINHYSLTTVKVSMVATLIQREEHTDTIEKIAENLVYRWLKEHFKSIKVTSVHTL